MDPGVETPDHIVNRIMENYGGTDLSTLRDSGEIYGLNIGFNEAKTCALNPYDCLRAQSASHESAQTAAQRFPSAVTNDNIQDAYRHCLWQALTTIRANAQFALEIGNAHEIDHPGTAEAAHMDQVNNSIGRSVGLRHEGDEIGAANECYYKAVNGELITIV